MKRRIEVNFLKNMFVFLTFFKLLVRAIRQMGKIYTQIAKGTL